MQVEPRSRNEKSRKRVREEGGQSCMGVRGWRSASRTRFNPPAIGFKKGSIWGGGQRWDREMSIKDS